MNEDISFQFHANLPIQFACKGGIPSDIAPKGFVVVSVSSEGITSDQGLLQMIANGLEFPDYFGSNWDALDECLSDLEWLPATGYLVWISGVADSIRRCPEAFGRLIAAWLDAAASWKQQGVPFCLVLDLAGGSSALF